MQHLDLTFPTSAENIACDEALLDWCEDGYDTEILRFWEPRRHFVVLGYTNKIQAEVNVAACEARDVPILRRTSGGGTVLQGPGCLNYALILKIQQNGGLDTITGTNRFIMQRQRQALEAVLGAPVEVRGFTDLTLGDLKFSGNAQRRKRRFLLFHGSLLLDFEIRLIDELLAIPARQPEYRRNRPHSAFLTNLHVQSRDVRESLRRTWGATSELAEAPLVSMDALVAGKYLAREWTHKF